MTTTAERLTLEGAVRVLGARKAGPNDYRAACCAHGGDNPDGLSLRVGRASELLVTCHTKGCDGRAILAAIRERAGLPGGGTPAAAPPRQRAPLGAPVATYVYQAADGTPVGEVRRYEPAGEGKTFRQYAPDGTPKAPRALAETPYQLPAVRAEIEGGAGVVFVVEGEKDVETLRGWGLVATCNTGGAEKWSAAHAAHIAGARDVIILPDHDDAGRRHAAAVARSLFALSDPPDVRVVHLPGLAEKADVTDWACAGRTCTELLEIAHGVLPATRSTIDAACGLVEAPPDVPNAEAPALRPPFYDDAAVELLPAPVYVADDFLVRNGLSVAYGPPACAKTFFALALGCSVRSGRGLFGRAVRRGGVVYVAAEGSAGLGVRLRAWKQQAGYSGRLGVQFRLEPVQLLDPAEVGRFIDDMRTLDEAPAVIVLDTFHRCLVNGDENSSQDVGNAIAAIDRMRRETGAGVLLLHHTRVDGERERGSTALRGAADTMIAMKAENGAVRVTCEKQKDGPVFDPFTLRLQPVAESCVLVTPTAAWEREARDLGRQHLQALESLSRDFLAEGATAAKWQTASKVPESSFYRVRTDLVTWGYVAKESRTRGALYTLSEAGRAAIAPSSQVTPNSPPESDHHSLPSSPAPIGAGRNGSERLETLDDLDAAYLADERAAFEQRAA